MLPALRPGEAYVIGDSVLMPMRTLVKIPDPLPRSGNVDFFHHWAADDINVDVDDIIDHWRLQDRQRFDGLSDDDQPPDNAPAPQAEGPRQSAAGPGNGVGLPLAPPPGLKPRPDSNRAKSAAAARSTPGTRWIVQSPD